MYIIGRKWYRIETVGRKPLSKPEPYIGCSALEEEEEGFKKNIFTDKVANT
jgi:hypothetical protein